MQAIQSWQWQGAIESSDSWEVVTHSQPQRQESHCCYHRLRQLPQSRSLTRTLQLLRRRCGLVANFKPDALYLAGVLNGDPAGTFSQRRVCCCLQCPPIRFLFQCWWPSLAGPESGVVKTTTDATTRDVIKIG